MLFVKNGIKYALFCKGALFPVTKSKGFFRAGQRRKYAQRGEQRRSLPHGLEQLSRWRQTICANR